MNNSNKTTRELAIEYWGKIDTNKQRELTKKYYPDKTKEMGFNRAYLWLELSDRDKIYLSEHPQTEINVPEWCKQPDICGKSLSGKCICPKPEVDEDKDIEKLEQQLWDEPTGAPTSKPEVDVEDAYKNMPNWKRDYYKNWREWAEKCFDAGKKEMAEENKSLREANERMKEALEDMIWWFDNGEGESQRQGRKRYSQLIESVRAALQANPNK